jgi:nucleoprotein TPR
MMEEREKQAKEIVEGIEKEWAGVGDRAERREAALKDEIEKERRAKEQAQKRVEQLEAVLERMDRGELPTPGRPAPGIPRTPVRTSGTPDLLTEGMMGLSPTVAMASKAQRSGKTFTEVYADYVRLQEDFAKKTAEYDHMDRTLSAVLAQIEERVRSKFSDMFPLKLTGYPGTHSLTATYRI